MKIGGLQRLTLLDYPNLVACIIFMAGCNFRCPYCHNGGLVIDENVPLENEDSVFEYLKKRKGLLDGVVISGGEPLLQEDILNFMASVKELGYKIKLDTNGSQFERLKAVIDKNLVDYVAMDIKSSKENYYKAIGHSNNFVVQNIDKSIELLKNSGIDYEFRTTVVKGIHSREDIVDIAKWIKGDMPYFLQDYVASEGVINNEGICAFGKNDLSEIADEVRKYCPNIGIR